MQNKTALTTGIAAAIGSGLCTTLFAVFIIIGTDMLSYFICILLAIFYLAMSVSNDSITKADYKIFSNIAVVFAAIYCTLICIVYYVQITFIRLGNPSHEALAIVSYFPPGTAFFALDILGYSFLGLSTFFLAFSIDNKRLLRTLLIVHGIVGTSGFIVPLLPFFYDTSDKASGNYGSIALLGWCVLFIPICILFARYFMRKLQNP